MSKRRFDPDEYLNGFQDANGTERARRLPLSFFQERLFYLYQVRPKDTSYNANYIYRIRGALDVDRVRSCFAGIVEHDDMLRSTFSYIGHLPFRLVSEKGALDFSYFDLNSVPEVDREIQALSQAKDRTQVPYKLEEGPLFRVALYRLGLEEHLLSMDLCHLITDNRSNEIIMERLHALYDAFSDQKPALPPLPRSSYGDFVAWQRGPLREVSLDRQKAYWQERLRGIPGMLQLPMDGVRPHDILDAEFSTDLFNFLPALGERLVEFAREQEVTPFAVLLSAYQVVLSRLSGSGDIAVGVPISIREEELYQDVVGPFINTAVIRGTVSGELNFAEFLKQTQQRLAEALLNPDVTVEALVELLDPVRSASHTPIFQVSFNFIRVKKPKGSSHYEANLSHIDSRAGPMDLHLLVLQDGNHLRAQIRYNKLLFGSDCIRRLWSHCLVFLEAAVVDPNRRTADFPILTESEWNQVVQDWNQTKVGFNKLNFIDRLFEEQAKDRPEAIALEFLGHAICYRDLNERSGRLANHLKKMGVRSESAVGIYLDRSVEMVVALLAIFKAGGAYVPLDPSYPKDRLIYMLEDSGISLLISQTSEAHQIFGQDRAVLSLEENADAIAHESPMVEGKDRKLTDLAYILYTSGSTGRPKGVQIEHRSILNFLKSMQREPGFSAKDVLVSMASLSFDMACFEILLPLITGAKVVIASREERRNGHLLKKLVKDATFVQATPVTWRMLVDCGWQGSPALRIVCTGEPLTAELVELFSSRCGELWNLYGPTEITVYSNIKKIDFERRNISIGRPIANAQVYILDQQLKPVPIGVTGEICIGGIGLARGYRNLPELTERQFVSNPFSKEPGARLYRTGDLGCFLDNGEIRYLGRSDQQVKVRGFRIELGEIETVLAAHPAVRSTTVLVRPATQAEPASLSCFVIPRTQSCNVRELAAFLRVKLPDFMIPSEFQILDEWPLTSTGKIDRASLLKREAYKVDSTEKFDLLSSMETATQLERRSMLLRFISREVKELLGLDPRKPLDPTASLVTMGMNSFYATRFSNRIKAAVGERGHSLISQTLVYNYPSIEQLADFLMKDVFSPEAFFLRPKSQVALSGAHDPIAIIGMSARFPGGVIDPDSFWNLLARGGDAITPVPSERIQAGTYSFCPSEAQSDPSTMRGGFLEGVDLFDAGLFNIAPLEARAMSPDQRLLLEGVWEALEQGGESPADLFESNTGVFLGIVGKSEYLNIHIDSGALKKELKDPLLFTGNLASTAAGRLSYFLGLRGPAMSIDTACSSSLVALDAACRYLRSGSCDRAIVGGVNLMLTSESNVLLAETGVFSKTGRCNSFDASADGFVRAEGCGVVILKRLLDANANQDSVLAVIRGSAVNQDGRSQGLMAPNGRSQEEVIRGALKEAGVAPSEVSYVEAQGSATPLGDPIELQALGQVYQVGRDEKCPLIIGSVKSNIGNAEAAAGIAGVIKTVLALQHGKVPGHPHFSRLNPGASLANIPAVIPTSLTEWIPMRGKRIAGVSSFGMSGTNAHLVLEEAPIQNIAEIKEHLERPMHLFTLSARTESALKTLAMRYSDCLAKHPEYRIGDICSTANIGRHHHQNRIAVVSESSTELRRKLDDLSKGRLPEGLKMNTLEEGQSAPDVIFLFSGEGTQLFGVGRCLYETQPVFKHSMNLCAKILEQHQGRSLMSTICDVGGDRFFQDHDPDLHAAAFAVGYSLSQLWMSWGVKPVAVVGYGAGELLAACVAGVFSIEDGLRLIRSYSRLGHSIHAASRSEPSPQMDPIWDEFEKAAGQLQYSKPLIRMISNVTGKRVPGDDAGTARYWSARFRTPVRYEDGIQKSLAEEYGPVIEIDRWATPSSSSSLETEVWRQLLETLGSLYAQGTKINWRKFDEGYPRRKRLSLPTYPFQRQRYWSGPALGGAGSPHASDFQGKFLCTSPAERHQLLMQWIQENAAKVLGLKSGYRFDVHSTLGSQGINSLLAVHFIELLNDGLRPLINRPLPFRLVLTHPTMEKIAEWVEQELEIPKTAAPGPDSNTEPDKTGKHGPTYWGALSRIFSSLLKGRRDGKFPREIEESSPPARHQNLE